MMKDYPFVYLNHGEIDPETVGKNEEIFIWFKREVNKEEQKGIMEGCPRPLNCVYCWGKEFVYFGSGGDTYDFDILDLYANEESKILGKLSGMDKDMEEEDAGSIDAEGKDFDDVFQDALTKALPLFEKDIESWVHQVNEIVPIVFFYAPNLLNEADEWAAWSEENVYSISIPYLRKYMEKNPGIFTKENEEKRFFGYIYKFLLKYMITENRNMEDVLRDIEMSFELDNIKNPFDRLNIEDSNLQGNCNILYGVLEEFASKERVEYINRLKPYTQLAYYASYAANRNHDILVHPDPLEFLKKLIAALPADRKNIIGTYLRFAAENLVHVGPAFSGKEKNDRTYAGLAAEIMDFSLHYNSGKEAYINGAAFYDWQQNFEGMLRISLEGDKKFPGNNTIIANILYSAEKCGLKDIVDEFVNRKTEDPLVLANQSFSLVKSGKLKEAYDLLMGHFNKRGEFNEYSLNNLLYLCTNFKMPDEQVLRKIIELSVKNLKENANYRNIDFINNLMILFNNTGNYKRSIEVFKDYMKQGGHINCSLCCNYTYAGSMTGDKDTIEKVLREVIELYKSKKDEFVSDEANIFILLGNMAGMYAITGYKEKMLEFLKMTKQVHPDFNRLKQDTDFKNYWNDSDFLIMFN